MRDDLAAYRAVNYLSSATGRAVPLEFTVNDEVLPLLLSAAVSVTGTDLYTGAAVAGLGLVRVPRYRIAKDLEERRLQEVLKDAPPLRYRSRCCTRGTASCPPACGCLYSGWGKFSRQQRRAGLHMSGPCPKQWDESASCNHSRSNFYVRRLH